jgi:hypothetical protein
MDFLFGLKILDLTFVKKVKFRDLKINFTPQAAYVFNLPFCFNCCYISFIKCTLDLRRHWTRLAASMCPAARLPGPTANFFVPNPEHFH